jgi:hypothetical protein
VDSTGIDTTITARDRPDADPDAIDYAFLKGQQELHKSLLKHLQQDREKAERELAIQKEILAENAAADRGLSRNSLCVEWDLVAVDGISRIADGQGTSLNPVYDDMYRWFRGSFSVSCRDCRHVAEN